MTALLLWAVTQIAPGVPGVFLPAEGVDGPAPAVLMLHGFGSDKDEVGDLYARLAARLAKVGVASLRIDFRGFGESKVRSREATITGQLEDAEVALRWLRARGDVDKTRVGLLGFSLGGGVALISAGRHPELVRALGLWSSAPDVRPTAEERPDIERQARAKGPMVLDLGFRTLELGSAWFQSRLDAPDALALGARFRGRRLVVAGADDPLSRHVPALMTGAAPGSQSLVMKGADHIFRVRTDKALARRLLTETTRFFQEALRAPPTR